MEGWRGYLTEQEDTEKQFLMAAAYLFAKENVAGKEEAQLPTTIIISSRESGGEFVRGAKKTGETFKSNKDGSAIEVTTYSGKRGGFPVNNAEKTLMTKQNDMNYMLKAVQGILLFAKGNSPEIYVSSSNPYVEKIKAMAVQLKQSGQGIGEALAAAKQTSIYGNAMISSKLSVQQMQAMKTGTKDREGELTRQRLVSTSVQYILGPGLPRPNIEALNQKMNAQGTKYETVFGAKGILGSIEDVTDSLSGTGMNPLGDTPEDFKRKLDRAMGK